MKEADTGGSAFPQIYELGDINYASSAGMTLRDYFAGQFLVGLFARGGTAEEDEYASVAYTIADAMIEKRKMKEGGG